ncbi:hypothetical protein U0070_008936 [Myodes glareolus]|uniref:Uncharacterized protein n=1 Tax=Myodes glareolus TaxID=447135 RepID=A0AAW0JNV0_MYOGA
MEGLEVTPYLKTQEENATEREANRWEVTTLQPSMEPRAGCPEAHPWNLQLLMQ